MERLCFVRELLHRNSPPFPFGLPSPCRNLHKMIGSLNSLVLFQLLSIAEVIGSDRKNSFYSDFFNEKQHTCYTGSRDGACVCVCVCTCLTSPYSCFFICLFGQMKYACDPIFDDSHFDSGIGPICRLCGKLCEWGISLSLRCLLSTLEGPSSLSLSLSHTHTLTHSLPLPLSLSLSPSLSPSLPPPLNRSAIDISFQLR